MELEIKPQININGDSEKNDKDDDGDDGWKEMGFFSKVSYVFQNITVEPLLALFQVSSVLSSLTTQNLNLKKACRVNLQLDDEVCYGLENKNITMYETQEVAVQELVANMLIWQTAIQSSLPCVLLVFIGSWSDRHGRRKPFMLVPVVGEILRNIGLLLCVYYFFELRMEVAGLVESIPTALAGGLPVLYMAAFSYMGDISSVKNRTVRVGLMNLFFGAAWPVGAILSGVLYQELGYYGVYYISTTLYAIAFLYTVIRITEKPKPQLQEKQTMSLIKKSNSFMERITDFFNLKHLIEAFRVTFQRSSRTKWVRLYILLFIVVAVQGPMEGETSVGYLYTRVRFNWNEVDYSMFSTVLFLVNIIGVVISTGILSHLLKMDDALIGVFATISKIVSGIIYAFAPTGTIYYVGAVADIMSGTSHIIVRSILSKIVSHGELGQVSSVVAVIETIIPIVFKPMYSAIYKATVHSFPGAFYLIGSAMFIPSVFLYWWMYRINKREEKNQLAIENNKSNTDIQVPHST